MSKNKYYVDIGSAYTTIYSNILLLKEPTCLILKNGYNSKLIAAGREALFRKHLINEDEQFIKPVMEGAVMHYAGTMLMLKALMSKAGVKRNSEIIVYFSCGLNSNQRLDLENVFLEAGYKNIMLCERILALKPYVASYGNMVIADIGDSHTDVGIINEDGIVSAYNLDIGGMTVTNKIIKKVESLYNLNITYSAAEKIKTSIGSLYEYDKSKMILSGRDIISGSAKNVEIYSTDIYEDIISCYKRIAKVIEGLLVVAPLECIEGISQRGIFAIGGGSRIKGFEDFIFSHLSLPLTLIDNIFYI